MEAHDFLLLGLVRQTAATEIATRLFQVVQSLFNPLDILEAEFGLDDFHVADGVDITLDVDDFCVVKSTNDLEYPSDGADMRQEGITKTGSSRSTLDGENQKGREEKADA